MSRGLGNTQQEILWTLFCHGGRRDRYSRTEFLAQVIYHPPSVPSPRGHGWSNGPVTAPMLVATRRAIRGLIARGLAERDGRHIQLTEEGRQLMNARQR